MPALSEAISAHELDGAEPLPDWQCETCGAAVTWPGLCPACLKRLDEFEINCIGTADPRR